MIADGFEKIGDIVFTLDGVPFYGDLGIVGTSIVITIPFADEVQARTIAEHVVTEGAAVGRDD